MPPDPSELGRRLRAGDRSAAPAALNVIENRADREAAAALLAEVSPAELGGEAPAHLIGITGPPGAGKSTLLSALVAEWRGRGRTVAVLAVDPSSKRSGGSLLADRARIEHDPRDDGVLIRSTAAGGRLGGLARADREAAAALLAEVSPAELGGEAPAHLIGITGPPGAGKSTLLSALVAEWRGRGRTVAVLAVDPSSKRSGGSLLADRARIEHDPRDDGVLIRSTAAGGRLGGLAVATREASDALAAAFDVVVVETVGVGQSETDVEEVCDTVAVVVQPASGDVLQFLKAGIMEVPDVLAVTKADLGDAARRAQRDLEQALAALGSSEVPVVAVSSLPPPSGIPQLADALDAHREGIDVAERRLRARRASALREFTAEHGEGALRALGGRREAERLLAAEDPAADVTTLIETLKAHA